MTSVSVRDMHAVQYNATHQRWVKHRAVVLLTPSEQRILKMLAKGLGAGVKGAGEIARSPKTVEAHVVRLRDKMGIPSVEQLAIAAEQLYPSGASVPQVSLANLTERQAEALGLLAEGRTYEEMSEQLGIDHRSVHARVRAIKDKLGVEELPLLRAAARKALGK